MKKLSFALAATCALLLTGCVTPNYKAPSGQPIATLTVITNTPETFNQQVRLLGDRCTDYPGQLAGLLHSKRIGIDTKESITTAIPVGKPITVSVYAGVPRDDSFLALLYKNVEQIASENRWCEAFVSFVPEAGETYRAAYKIDGTPCSISLMKEQDGQQVLVTHARPSAACSAAAKASFGALLLTN